MQDAYFIAGTDTDIGKTHTAVAIMHHLIKKGHKVAGYKPIAAGSIKDKSGILKNSDAISLKDASNIKLTYSDVNPYALIKATSPHIAARAEQIVIDFKVLSDGLAKMRIQSDIVIVEGAGGWHVPVSETQGLAAWVAKEQLAVILVVGMKLGCLNHALLTAQAIKAQGLEIAGWIANSPVEQNENYAPYLDWLIANIKAPFLGEIGFNGPANFKF